MRGRIAVGLALASIALVPRAVLGQQTAGVIAGQVRDGTGGVLPGVTVEVASPALIERVRSVATDDAGQYRVVELRPGEYTVTFTLAGFGKLVRENVQLTSGFTATVNAELKVGDIAETITVSGVSPVVDVQNVTQQSVLTKTTLEAIPSGGSYGAIGRLIPGVDGAGNSSGVDVGGSTGRDSNKLVIHGSATNDFKLLIDGMPQSTFAAGNGGDNVGVPPSNSLAEEVNLQYSALPAEVESGGVLMNMVPKTGGNAFRASFFSNVATGAMQAENLTPALRAQGVSSGGEVDYVTDVNPSFGGPLQRDRLWFFVTYRDWRPYQFSSNYFDANKTDFVYTPDTGRAPAYDAKPQKSVNGRITWQATPRNRFSLGLEFAKLTQINQLIGSQSGGASVNAAEATPLSIITNKPIAQVGWTAPLNNRLLIDFGGQVYRARWWSVPQTDISVAPGALETATGVVFRSAQSLGIFGYGGAPFFHDYLRGAASYTTGSHAIKVGGTLWHGGITSIGDSQGYGAYFLRLLNGVPNAVVYRVDQLSVETRFLKGALYAQDQWTARRLTVNYGLRIDTIDSGYPAQHEPATAYFPARDFTAGSVLRWRDWSPRLGVAYDLFGNGRTAVKASYSRYVAAEAQGATNTANPAQASGGTLQRTWNDNLICPICIRGDFIPQGDPTNPVANGELTGPSPNANWGQPVFATRYDPAWSKGGWGVRGYNWERSVTVQQELRSNVSLNVGFFYRTYGNFTITDNAATAPSDYDSFCITGPADARLPNGGGNRLCGLYDVKPAAASRLDNLVTLASNYGDIQQNYKGIDAAVNLRLRKALVQGGLNSGRELYDFCDIVATVPERLISGTTKTPADQCRQVQPMRTQVKLLGSYELPWAWSVAASYMNSPNFQAASNFLQGQPRMGIAANYVATNAVIAPELGRNLSAGANANATVNVVTPGTLWGIRLQQLDLRVGRTFKTGRASIKAMVDLYNAFNANTVLAFNQTYGTTGAAWFTPVAIVPARLMKLGIQIDY
jgi:hypothetical protein